MFPHRCGSREPYVFQLQPLQSPLPSATQVPQVSAACQRGEQGKESPGGPTTAGTRGKEEGDKLTLSQEGSIHVFVFTMLFPFPLNFSSSPLVLSSVKLHFYILPCHLSYQITFPQHGKYNDTGKKY